MFTVKCIANFVNFLLYSSFPATLHSKDKMIVKIADEHLLSPLPPYRPAFARESSGKLKWRLKWRFRYRTEKHIRCGLYASIKFLMECNSIKFVMTV